MTDSSFGRDLLLGAFGFDYGWKAGVFFLFKREVIVNFGSLSCMNTSFYMLGFERE